ncbi:mannose-6-phosphate isomerase [Paraflavitalea soli]|uniref:Mannose-6-phosphate isomerase n=1 Tax=Paraflavitalea soli TaxID=2315862 RepID=A0A3B7MWG1_9BACT|nr:class I mannose-6-phosphate isomerase [Paraflavitalea soli]AXY78438.1 mannose-6-phosphate isomerase [Paraflavitalea soli]
MADNKHLRSNYDKFPCTVINEDDIVAGEGWEEVGRLIKEKMDCLPGRKVVVLDCYQGVREEELVHQLTQQLTGTFFYTKDYFLSPNDIQALVYPDVTDDEVFGYLTRLRMIDFFDPTKIQQARAAIQQVQEGPVYVLGAGASLLTDTPGLLVYFDMPRWEIQLRFRNKEVSNLGMNNAQQKTSLQYKQAFFVDWRVCDRHKKKLMSRWDLVVDTTVKDHPKIVNGPALNKAYQYLTTHPFRLVPFFDPGPWGGQWMKEVCDLDRSAPNYAWAFDGVPEENSLLFQFNGLLFETPAINLVFAAARPLLGEAVQARFGDEFPIRFDFLDTMKGGNLSLQVHPGTQYIQEHFGMPYTQDESYYMLDAAPDAVVYLGLKDGIDPASMVHDLQKAHKGEITFNADDYAAKWPVKKHDHFLIPAGTVHCSGSNSMVLEISATPYIFTFKLWDWGRMGLDGKPRPINIERGKEVIDWTRTPAFTRQQLINTVTTVAEGDGWKEERTGLHEREFIETRRHWFSKTVHHHTGGSVNVLNLVEGREAIVESPSGAFVPFIVHYAETFIIPQQVQEYTIRPHGDSEGSLCATLKAFVRI